MVKKHVFFKRWNYLDVNCIQNFFLVWKSEALKELKIEKKL